MYLFDCSGFHCITLGYSTEVDHTGIYFCEQESNLNPLHWENGVPSHWTTRGNPFACPLWRFFYPYPCSPLTRLFQPPNELRPPMQRPPLALSVCPFCLPSPLCFVNQKGPRTSSPCTQLTVTLWLPSAEVALPKVTSYHQLDIF